jgi:hypothetical protein
MVFQDRYIGLAVLALGGAAFLVAGSYPGGAQIVPRGIAVILIVAGLALSLRKTRMPLPETAPAEEGPDGLRPSEIQRWAITIGLGMSIAYVIGVAWLGYLTSSAIFVPATAYALGLRDWRWIIIGTVVFVSGSGVLFLKIFKAPLPPEQILNWF